MATIEVTQQADRDFLEDHEQVAIKLSELAASQRFLQERADMFQTEADQTAVKRDALGNRARSGLVRYKPGLDALLEQQLVNMKFGRVAGVIEKLLTNDEATA